MQERGKGPSGERPLLSEGVLWEGKLNASDALSREIGKKKRGRTLGREGERRKGCLTAYLGKGSKKEELDAASQGEGGKE